MKLYYIVIASKL